MNYKCHVLDVKPLLSRRHLQRLMTKKAGQLLRGPKSSFQIKANFAFQLEIKVPVWRCPDAHFFPPVMVWGVMLKPLHLITKMNQLYDIFTEFQSCIVTY